MFGQLENCIISFYLLKSSLRIVTLITMISQITSSLQNRFQELLEVHRRKYPDSDLRLSACSRCGQVLVADDVAEHDNYHGLDQDFPMLGIK